LTIPEILLNVESLHRAHPNTNRVPDDEITRLLKSWTIG
jgi:hypothetical protein